MNYAQIRKMDISNGEYIGVSLFVSGCHFHCKNCFNSIAWDYNYGQRFTEETMQTILQLLQRDFIKRFTILGGEPLDDKNIETVYKIIQQVRQHNPNIKIWLYSGYTLEEIMKQTDTYGKYRQQILKIIDVLVDGQYVDELKNLNLQFRGSSNQRIIRLKEEQQ